MIYGAGAAAGFTPQEVGCMSLWEFMAAMDGWRRANCPDDDGLSGAEIEDVASWMGI